MKYAGYVVLLAKEETVAEEWLIEGKKMEDEFDVQVTVLRDKSS